MQQVGKVRGRRGGDGPLQVEAEVVDCRRDGAYWTLRFAAPPIAERARPGQFVQLAVGGSGMLLRRPFSVAGVTRDGDAAGTVEVTFDAHGPGTEWLAGLGARQAVDVVGPLGTSFALPPDGAPCLLVGGGYGIAPLFFLAQELASRGSRVDTIVGAASRDRLLGEAAAERLSTTVTYTTDDGSHGTRGRVTDVLEQVAQVGGSRVVYACGPNPMLRAVSERARDLGLRVQVAVEERMACGIGVCFTCVLPVRDEAGVTRMTRSCLDGPVFDGGRIAWSRSRYGPATSADTPEVPLDRVTDAAEAHHGR